MGGSVENLSMSQIAEVKAGNDLIEIIGERLSLQRSGSQFRALCPFHSEKSPSFFVSQEFQRYKCFGCGENGDVFTFLEKYEGMTFQEALQMLAERAGITLESYRPTHDEDQRTAVLAVQNLAKEYYHFLLTKHEAGETARQYLKERGVTAESIRLFQIGFSLPAWDGLVAYLHGKKKYSLEILLAAGLVIAGKNGRYYDRFRGRIMFPLNNRRGQVVGFSGRVLEKDTKDAKYINSPETSVYHKSEMLFGYSELLQEIRKKKEVVVVEGEFDVISSTQAHVNHVVAIKGSALTMQHLQLISRVADKILFSLDMDSAGVAATKRAITILKETSLEARVVVVPSGKDPDELARTQPAAWREAVKASISIYDYLLQAAQKQHDAATPEGKRAIIDDLAPVISSISHAVERDVYLKKLATILSVKESLVAEDIEKFKQGKMGNRPIARKAKADSAVQLAPSRQAKLEKYILHLLLTAPTLSPTYVHALEGITFELPGAKALLTAISQGLQGTTLTQLIKELPEDLKELYFEIASDPRLVTTDPKIEWADEWQKAVTELQQESTKQQVNLINQKISEFDNLGHLTPEQEAEQTALLQEVVMLRKKLRVKSGRVE